MGLETGTYISDLNASNPASGDGLGQADDHLRLIKAVVKATFPNITGAVTATQTELNQLHTGTRTLGLADGSAAVPSLYFDSDTDNGAYRIGANNWALTVGGAKVVDLATTGAAITGTLAATGGWAGDFSVATSKFTVASATGNTAVLGDFAVNTNKFTVAAASGNTAVAGTLGVTGTLTGAAATLSGLLTLSSTSHWIMAKGTSAQRPGSPAAGHERFNADTSCVEFYDGARWRSWGKAPTKTIVTATGTYTTATGATKLHVRYCGGGGGGGARDSTGSLAGAGGDSAWDTTGANVVAKGGTGGGPIATNPGGGPGGTGGTGTAFFRADGQRGQNGTADTTGYGGNGGSTIFGSGARAQFGGTGAGDNAAANSGGGGGGGSTSATGGGGGGGAGEYVELWVNNPSASYAVTIGAGGAGGQGTGLGDGGNGGSGVMWITEFYD